MDRTTASNSPKMLTILIAVTLTIAVLIVWKSVRSAKAMSAAMNTDVQMADATPGTMTKIVVQVEQMPSAGTIQATVLNKKTEEIYVRGKVPVTFYYSLSKVKIVMGTAPDLHTGAIVHATGKVRNDRGIDVEQFVILTGFVRIE